MQRRSPMITYKQAIQTSLLNYLYEPVRQRHDKQIEALTLKNCTLRRAGVRAFRYKGDLFRSVEAPIGPIMAPRLHEDLEWEMAQMLEEQREIREVEEPMVKGYITLVLNKSDSIDDYLALLPDAVHRYITELNLPYRSPRLLLDSEVQAIIEKHARCIQLIKERMVSNLIFQ